MNEPGDERLRGMVPRMAAAVQEMARELQLTNDELMAVLSFLKEVADADELVLLTDVMGVSSLVDDQTHAGSDATANNVLGPFYVPGAPWVDNPGTIVPDGATGEQIELAGRVTDFMGNAIDATTLDVWQADADGRYSNEYPDGPPWALRGRQRTDEDGRYRLATISPRHYTVKHDGPVGRLLARLGRHPWRPAHIHFLVTAPGFKPLVTQVYVAGSPYLDDDAISGVKDELIRPIEGGRLRFDIVLARA